jgi:hypothetical protein
LLPGGSLRIHGLAGDRPLAGPLPPCLLPHLWLSAYLPRANRRMR